MSTPKPNSFLSMWFKPSQGVNYIQQSPLFYLRMIFGLTLIYFLQSSVFILSLEKLTIAPLMTLKGMSLIIYFFLTIGVGSVFAIYSSTFAIWLVAKCLNGKGTLPQNRAAVIWTLIVTIPIGFFLLLIYFAFKRSDLGQIALVIRIISYLGVVATLIYGFITLIKTVAETHRFSHWRAFFSIIAGAFILYPAVMIAFGLLR